MLEQRYPLQEFPVLSIFFFISSSTARVSDRQARAIRKMHKLLELFTQSKLDDIDSTGDTEDYKRESETVIFAGALLVLLAMVVWSLTVKVWFD